MGRLATLKAEILKAALAAVVPAPTPELNMVMTTAAAVAAVTAL